MRRVLFWSGLVGLMVLMPRAPASAGTTRKLIEFGWDEPDTGFLRTNVAQMQLSVFDGCVFHVLYPQPGGAKGNFTWQAWGTRTFTEADLQEAFSDLRATRFGRFKSNFLRFNTTPARLDWFDDYAAVLANARLAARLARAGHCAGLLFDIEQYEGPLFNYRQQRDAGSKSWELYAAQARLRGRQVMDSFQAGYPGLNVFLTFGYSLPWLETEGGRKPLADCSYGLLAPFLDGMVETAKGRGRLVDGYETAYGFKTAAQFARARRKTFLDLLPIVRDPDQYHRTFSLGFGLWLDFDSQKRGWNTDDLTKNYFSPKAFAASVSAASNATDEFVWIYSQTPRWWTPEGKPANLPEPYLAAVKKAWTGRRPAPAPENLPPNELSPDHSP